MGRWWWVPGLVGLLIAAALMGPMRPYERTPISPGYCPWFGIQYVVSDPSSDPSDPTADDLCETAAANRVPRAGSALLGGLTVSTLLRRRRNLRGR